MSVDKEAYFGALTLSGMPEIPQEFSVTPLAQFIPRTTLAEIDKFIRLFDQITTRPGWQNIVTASAPQIAQFPRSEVAFRNQLATFIEREIKQFFGSLPEVYFIFLRVRMRSVAASFIGNSSCFVISCATRAGSPQLALLRTSGGTASIFS